MTPPGYECPHGETVVGLCPPCNPTARAFTTPAAPEFGAPFTARFNGWCDGCDGPIRPDDSIRRQVGTNRYRHARCCPDERPAL